MNRFLSHLAALTRFEIADSVHSRRAAVVLALYLAAALLGVNAFATALQRLEQQLAELLQTGPAPAGALADSLWKSARFRQMIVALIGDRETALSLFSMPPIALLYGFLSFFYTPFFALLVSTPRVAMEVYTGSCRFVLFRTSRMAWILSKFIGQAVLVLLALALSTAGAWTLARFRLTGMDAFSAAAGIAIMSGKAWLFSLPFVAVGLAISQSLRSPNTAQALGFLAWIGTGALAWLAKRYAGEGIRMAWDVVALLVPQGFQLELWRMEFASFAYAALWLLVLTAAYLMLGFLHFSRQDL